MQTMPGGLSKRIYRGRLYAFDRQGKLAWPAPAEIRNQCLLVDQPSHLPVVIFACQRYEQKGNGVQFKASVLLIDKRSGRTAYTGELNNPMGVFHVVGNGERKTIDVVMQQKTIRLTFTDKPIPSPAAAGAKPAQPPAKSNPARALWDALKKVIAPGDNESDSESEEAQ